MRWILILAWLATVLLSAAACGGGGNGGDGGNGGNDAEISQAVETMRRTCLREAVQLELVPEGRQEEFCDCAVEAVAENLREGGPEEDTTVALLSALVKCAGEGR